jgi:lipopolysaccharide/colanic/teichoic acid biosynthesis glycosyltransferase
MWKTFLTVTILLLIAVVLLSVSILIKKNGKFPNIHVGSNPAMRKRHIGCVESQDKQAQKSNPMAVSEKSK